MKTLLVILATSLLALSCSLSPREGIAGDVDHSGSVDSVDAAIVMDMLAGRETGGDSSLADVSGDGTISAFDAALILKQTKGALNGE